MAVYGPDDDAYQGGIERLLMVNTESEGLVSS